MRQRRSRIGIVAPASPITRAVASEVEDFAHRRFPERRFELFFHPQCFLSSGHFAGDDAARTDALASVANDPSLDAVWFARGGYGSFRVVEGALPRLEEAARRKVYVGYSDIGSLLGALYVQGFTGLAHGPMPTDIRRPGGETAVARTLAFLLDGAEESVEPTALSGPPTAAFNLTILSHLVGTPWEPVLDGHVLMLEDVAEPMYRIDRYLGHITSAPAMKRLAGIRLGRCSKIVANDPDFCATAEDVVRYWCGRSQIPYLGPADIGHDIDNKIVPFGSWHAFGSG